MSDEKKAFYEYHSCLMEPWDGPASIAFTDGKKIGAVLDRNGLRPSRYYVTKDDLVIMASEVGVLDVPPERVLLKGRLQPGRMFLVDTEEGRIVADEEIKRTIATEQPYRQWLNQHMLELAAVPEAVHVPEPPHQTVLQRQQAFGYTFEDLRILMAPMARDGVEAVGSMGNDTPLAVLSSKPQLLYNYFKQLFAQVTNPPIDCIREELVTSAETTIGSERNLLKPKPMSCNLIELKSPILTNEEFAKLKYINQAGFKSVTLPILFKAAGGEAALAKAMDDLCACASQRGRGGRQHPDLVRSRRGRGTGAHSGVAGGGRRASSSDSRRHAHPGRAGAGIGRAARSASFLPAHRLWRGAINPYLAFETLDDMIRQGLLTNITHKDACKNFVKAAVKGVVKVISKMGISTIQSYRGAQIFEAIGLHPSVVEKYFTGTASRVGGDRSGRHRAGSAGAPSTGLSQTARSTAMCWMPAANTNGGRTASSTCSIRKRSMSCRKPAAAATTRSSRNIPRLVNDQSKNSCTLRGLLELKPVPSPSRSRKSSRWRRFSSASRPAPCPTAPSARRRTKPWPSP